jgi:uncharacterized protein (UPF0333 family)
MDSKAQVSFEYFILIALFMLMTTLVLVFSMTLYFNKEATKSTIALYTENILKMMG